MIHAAYDSLFRGEPPRGGNGKGESDGDEYDQITLYIWMRTA
jgi:hypothetical protein